MAAVTVVVVPARDEEERIATCLAALAAQTVGADAFDTILVDDASTDRTVAVARTAADRLGLTMTVVDGPGGGSGPARATGMDAAARRLLSAGHVRGLIASTDADSAPAPDWLERQLAHVARGADVVAGLIELDDRELPAAVMRRRRIDARRRLAAVVREDPRAGHHHFAGASLGVTAGIYRAVGGMQRPAALEDEAFAARLRAHRVPILRAADVRVRTAARTTPRADRGLGVDLAVSLWRERRRYLAADYPLRSLAAAPRAATVSVVVTGGPAAAAFVEATVGPARAAGLVDELVVLVEDGPDATGRGCDPVDARLAAAGARVHRLDRLVDELGAVLGVGDAMWRALTATGGEIVCFLAPGAVDPDPRRLLGLLGPLLHDPGLALVKGAFAPTADGARARDDDRIGELMARPLVNLHFPLLAGFSQPFGATFAARRGLLERLAFPVGDGVGLSILIDALREVGLDALGECELGGGGRGDRRPLRALGESAFAVLAAAERRLARPAGVTHGQFVRPWEDGAALRVPVEERPSVRAWRAGARQVAGAGRVADSGPGDGGPDADAAQIGAGSGPGDGGRGSGAGGRGSGDGAGGRGPGDGSIGVAGSAGGGTVAGVAGSAGLPGSGSIGATGASGTAGVAGSAGCGTSRLTGASTVRGLQDGPGTPADGLRGRTRGTRPPRPPLVPGSPVGLPGTSCPKRRGPVVVRADVSGAMFAGGALSRDRYPSAQPGKRTLAEVRTLLDAAGRPPADGAGRSAPAVTPRPR